MEVYRKVRARLNLRKLLKAALIFLVVFSITGFLVLPPIIKSVLLKKLTETLHREVTIQAVRVNPFLLSVMIRGLEIKEPDKQQFFAAFDELYLNFQTTSLFRRGIILKEIRLVKPYLNVVRREDLSYNFSDLMEPGAQQRSDAQKTDGGSGLRYSLNNIQIVGARIDFMDGPKHTKHTVEDALLTIPFVSNLPYHLDSYVQPAFSAVVNGHGVAFAGSTKPFIDSLETNIDVNVKDLDIPYYLAYSPVPLDYKIVSGFFSTQSNISYVQYKDKAPTLSLRGNSSLRKFRLTDKVGGQLISLPQVEIGISSSDVMAMNLHFSKIAIQSPEINVVIDKSGNLNLLKLIPETEKGEKKPLPAIEADEIALEGGMVTFNDASEGRAFKAGLEAIQVKISHFSTVKDKKTDIVFSCRTDTQEEIRGESSFSVEPLAAEGRAELKQVLLKKYSPYYARHINFSVEDGRLGLQTRYSYRQTGDGPDIGVSEFQAELKSLRLRKADETEDFLKIPMVSVKDLSADLSKKEMSIGEVSSHGGFILGRRYRVGTLLFATLVKVSEKVKPDDEAKAKGMPAITAERAWSMTVKKLLFDRYTIKFDDRMLEDPVIFTMDDVRIKGENLSTVRDAKGRISLGMKVEKKGTAAATGTISIEPASANLKLVTRNVPILPLQSYITDRINVFVTDGMVSSDGSLSFSQSKHSGPRFGYKGSFTINHFATIDKSNAEDFLTWDSLHLDQVDFISHPLKLSVNEVSLTDFYSRIIVNEDASLNLQNVLVKTEQQAARETASNEGNEKKSGGNGPQATATTPATEATEAGHKEVPVQHVIGIEKVTLQGGTVNFTDNYIKPNFTANMVEIGGRVTGLSSEETKMADVDLRGKLDNYAPLDITGRINPLRDDLFIDLKISFKDMDLSPLTPYSGRYLGYGIEKGKLALNLQYLIEKKKLDAQNKVLLDQFTLGSQVDSPEATKLPVKLAIALLKNRRGEIDLDVPVSGQIDDPKFSIGRIILKILLNLLVKAATSPFALLGAVFGGGEDLGYVEFEAGMSQLNEHGVKKLDTLGKALHDRPSLKMDIEGHADPEKDREGLKQYLFHRKVKAQKLKEIAQKGAEGETLDDIKIEPAEYSKYLKAAYKEERFPKPRNLVGMAKDLPVSEMEKLMLTHIEVKDDDLRRLASQRAMTAKDRLLRSKLVEQDRIFIVEPKTLQPEEKEKVKGSRVDFRLK